MTASTRLAATARIPAPPLMVASGLQGLERAPGTVLDPRTENVRIGSGARLLNEAGTLEADGEGGSYYIRDGIIIVPKNAMIGDGAII